MKRKPLSMKKLTLYTMEFMIERKNNEWIENGGDLTIEQMEEEYDFLKDFLEYIWKNPR